jgi:hypothetical protein
VSIGDSPFDLVFFVLRRQSEPEFTREGLFMPEVILSMPEVFLLLALVLVPVAGLAVLIGCSELRRWRRANCRPAKHGRNHA